MKPREWEIGEGGVGECPNYRWKCFCGNKCARCGHALHSAVHMHLHRAQPGSRPFGHRFEPSDAQQHIKASL